MDSSKVKNLSIFQDFKISRCRLHVIILCKIRKFSPEICLDIAFTLFQRAHGFIDGIVCRIHIYFVKLRRSQRMIDMTMRKDHCDWFLCQCFHKFS